MSETVETIANTSSGLASIFSKKNIMIIVGVSILLGGIMYYTYNNYPQLFGTPSTDHSGSNTCSMNNDKMAFFYATWCPACTAIKPVWDNVKQQLECISTTDVDCTEKSQESIEMMNKYNIEEIPTIILIKSDGSYVKFQNTSENMTSEELTHFIQSNQ